MRPESRKDRLGEVAGVKLSDGLGHEVHDPYNAALKEVEYPAVPLLGVLDGAVARSACFQHQNVRFFDGDHPLIIYGLAVLDHCQTPDKHWRFDDFAAWTVNLNPRLGSLKIGRME
jgi:hypothetical protein